MMKNRAKFQQNGSCGYILKPKYMLDQEIQYNTLTVNSSKKQTRFILQLISGDYLPCDKKEVSSRVSITIHGHKLDNAKWNSKTISTGGLNPVWNERTVFDIFYPELAIIEFNVMSVDDFSGTENNLGYFMISLPMIRKGYRRIILENIEGKQLTPAGLFVHCQFEELETVK